MKSDATLKSDIEQELFLDPTVDARRIDVTVHDGTVTLLGIVPSWAQKFAAQKAVQRVGGVRALVVELEIDAETPACPDAELAARIMSALDWQEALQDQAIRVEVDHGRVTLDGEVEWGCQRHAAETLVSRMAGVVGVANRIRVHATHTAPDICAEIADALARRAQRRCAAMSVEVADGVVTLIGTVDSMAEKRAAYGAAWSVKGVREVVDHLKVV
ncbi:BON domain-containing protein [Burkholderia contaminans]|uniref:BON domain-containing protein n=1 Tax=Burkholderia contaminans TaxID=488447 RepID=UPI00158C99DC|nr:BON domain-containing protein [Burkholderia contaminans]